MASYSFHALTLSDLAHTLTVFANDLREGELPPVLTIVNHDSDKAAYTLLVTTRTQPRGDK